MKTLGLNFESVGKPDESYIRSMFDRMARRYDTFTFLTGFGQARRWRVKALRHLKPGTAVLDLGCGTGDLALEAARRTGPMGKVVGLDFSSRMLRVAQHKYDRLAAPKSSFTVVCRKAEELPLAGQFFDLVVSGFVLRNLYENIDAILKGVLASLKPGGRIAFLDLTEPRHPVLRALFRVYMMSFVGLYGAALFGKNYPVPYLPDSASRFLKTNEFVAALKSAGFTGVMAHSFMFGAVTLYEAENPKA
jgi:demethylmenaquinone methyltransferase / 2-methoxy-6-polyprenyl-1,4-benzoquinol methylase